jgi:UDP-N-acetylmuramate--alanine ligase
VPEPGGPLSLRDEADAVRAWLRSGPRSVHLMGIGGVGVAALAVHLKARGLAVSGCDAAGGERVDWLRAQGIPVAIGHAAAHFDPPADALVRTAAVRDEHPECAAARAAGRPVFRRGVVLPALLDGRCGIAVSGTHGKTTTTAMIAQVLRGCGRDASFAVGGDVDVLGGVAAAGADAEFVVEADESDGTVAAYTPDYAVVTNVELDHVDHFTTDAMLHDFACPPSASQARVAAVCCDRTIRARCGRVGAARAAVITLWFRTRIRLDGPTDLAIGPGRSHARARGPGREQRSNVHLGVPGRARICSMRSPRWPWRSDRGVSLRRGAAQALRTIRPAAPPL